ncbi:MAG: NADH-quinone oxidoreductase subunit A [Chthoniobacterales bacterium]|jgi:NADH-quinone oxidoreductase subunit A
MSTTASDYSSLLIHVVVAVGFALTTAIGSLLLGRIGRRTGVKDVPYECGMLPEPGPQPRFSVKFYLVAMLFILFDIEIVFLYPWAVIYREYLQQFGTQILWVLVTFSLILFVGYIYAIKKGALNWSR